MTVTPTEGASVLGAGSAHAKVLPHGADQLWWARPRGRLCPGSEVRQGVCLSTMYRTLHQEPGPV